MWRRRCMRRWWCQSDVSWTTKRLRSSGRCSSTASRKSSVPYADTLPPGVEARMLSVSRQSQSRLAVLRRVRQGRWRVKRVSPYWIILMRISVKNRDDQIPDIKCGDTIQHQSCIQRNDFWFCWTVRNWSLLLAHPTYWYKCVTSENAQCSTLSRFWILKISCKIGVLRQTQTALFPHDNTVCTHKYDEYLKSNENRLSQALVHLVVDRASLFTDHRMSGRPTRAKYAAFRNNLRAYFWQFSYIIQFFFFEMMVINAWRRYCVELLSRFVRQLTISFHTFPGMTFQVIGTRRYCFRIRFPWSSDR